MLIRKISFFDETTKIRIGEVQMLGGSKATSFRKKKEICCDLLFSFHSVYIFVRFYYYNNGPRLHYDWSSPEELLVRERAYSRAFSAVMDYPLLNETTKSEC